MQQKKNTNYYYSQAIRTRTNIHGYNVVDIYSFMISRKIVYLKYRVYYSTEEERVEIDRKSNILHDHKQKPNKH